MNATNQAPVPVLLARLGSRLERALLLMQADRAGEAQTELDRVLSELRVIQGRV